MPTRPLPGNNYPDLAAEIVIYICIEGLWIVANQGIPLVLFHQLLLQSANFEPINDGKLCYRTSSLLRAVNTRKTHVNAGNIQCKASIELVAHFLLSAATFSFIMWGYFTKIYSTGMVVDPDETQFTSKVMSRNIHYSTAQQTQPLF